MNKIFLSNRLPSDYNRQAWISILRDIESLNNRQVDGYLFPVTSVTADYTVSANDSFIKVDATAAPVTITLMLASSGKEKRLTIKKIDSSANAVTVDGNGSETIDGVSTVSVPSQYNSVSIMSDGTEWWVV